MMEVLVSALLPNGVYNLHRKSRVINTLIRGLSEIGFPSNQHTMRSNGIMLDFCGNNDFA